LAQRQQPHLFGAGSWVQLLLAGCWLFRHVCLDGFKHSFTHSPLYLHSDQWRQKTIAMQSTRFLASNMARMQTLRTRAGPVLRTQQTRGLRMQPSKKMMAVPV
jgi:hypothetical protein